MRIILQDGRVVASGEPFTPADLTLALDASGRGGVKVAAIELDRRDIGLVWRMAVRDQDLLRHTLSWLHDRMEGTLTKSVPESTLADDKRGWR